MANAILFDVEGMHYQNDVAISGASEDPQLGPVIEYWKPRHDCIDGHRDPSAA
jgi:hypothetical protein